jgi:hypothetical protein
MDKEKNSSVTPDIGVGTAPTPESIEIELPLDIVMSLLRPDELEKLQKYIAAYHQKIKEVVTLGNSSSGDV